jgi:putative spermidine/putrescine transport system ATP-binding protein
VLVTHDQEEALSFADRVGVLRDGQLVQVGTPAAVWREPADVFVATFLGDMNLLPLDGPADGSSIRAAGVDGELQVLGARPEHGGVACLRPEALSVRADPDGRGTVVSAFYAGGSATYAVDVAGQRIKVRHQQPDGTAVLHVGDAVRISPMVDEVRLLPAGGATAELGVEPAVEPSP